MKKNPHFKLSPYRLTLVQDLWQQYGTAFLVGAMWAVYHEEAPFYPSLSLSQMCQRLLLAGGSWTVLRLGVMGTRPMIFYCRNTRLSFLGTKLAVKKDARLQTGMAVKARSGLSIAEAHSLMDCLLVFLLSEPLQNLSVPHMQAIANKLERAASSLHTIQPQVDGEDEEGRALVTRLKGAHCYLEKRAGLMKSLVKAQAAYTRAVHEAQVKLLHCWERLEGLHVRVTVPVGTEVDADGVLLDLEGLSAELLEHKNRLQACGTRTAESSDLLQELSRSTNGLEEWASPDVTCQWPENLLQSNRAQFNVLQKKQQSLEHITHCLRMHLNGLNAGWMANRGVCLLGCEPLQPGLPLGGCIPVELSPPPSPALDLLCLSSMDCLCTSVQQA